jgi:hypothetical protein
MFQAGAFQANAFQTDGFAPPVLVGAPGLGREYLGRQSRKRRDLAAIVDELELELRTAEDAATPQAAKKAAKRARTTARELEGLATARELEELLAALDSIIKAPRVAPAAAFERARLVALELADDDEAASAVLAAMAF